MRARMGSADAPSREGTRIPLNSFVAKLQARLREVKEAAPVPAPKQPAAPAEPAKAPEKAEPEPPKDAPVPVPDPPIKHKIREAAEVEERAFYAGRASETWLRDVEPFGTDENKPFLDEAPALIALFAQKRGDAIGERHYYVAESVGIALGFLLAALHHAGLATLTHTPSPMKFLSDILERPVNETAYMLIPVGYPADDCSVPDIPRKPLSEVLVKV